MPNSDQKAQPNTHVGQVSEDNIKLTSTTAKPSQSKQAASSADAASTPAASSSSSSSNQPAAKATTPTPYAGVTGTTQVNEQFSGNSLDSSLWQAMTRPKAYRNNEEQDYLPSQAKVANGTLQITANRDSSGNWHSAEVDSKWAYTYGEFEVRMALSATGPGVWPAAWLLGLNDQWPDQGEIDIMEHINSESTIYGTIHGGGSNGFWQLQKAAYGIDVTQFHTYKIVKTPSLISWWIDGAKIGEWTPSQLASGDVWPYENHKNIGILNVAIGGNWPGSSTAQTLDNIILFVDYFTVKNAS
jgi:beta-glucanase (GH16 family)